jgi:hypothetical protein
MEYGSFLPIITRFNNSVNITIVPAQITIEPEVTFYNDHVAFRNFAEISQILANLVRNRNRVIIVCIGQKVAVAMTTAIQNVQERLEGQQTPSIEIIAIEKVKYY